MQKSSYFEKPGSSFASVTRRRNSSILLSIFIILTFFLFFRQNLKEPIYLEARENSLYLSARSGDELSVDYERITAIELTDTFSFGQADGGSDTDKFRSGQWTNDTLGQYQTFTLKKVDRYIILSTDAETVVVNYESKDSTTSLYQAMIKLFEKKGMSESVAFTDVTKGAEK